MIMKSELKRIQKRCSVCSKMISWHEGEERPYRCPCGTIRWDKPKMEAQLFTLQEKYLEKREDKYFNEMFKIVYQYAKNVIRRALKNKKILDEFTIESKTQDATTKFLEYYLRKPNFYITDSFGVWIIGAVNYHLYYRKIQRIDKLEVSMNAPLDNDPDSTATLETKLSMTSKEDAEVEIIYEKNNEVNDLVENATKFLKKVFLTICKHENVSSSFLSFLLLHNLLINDNEKLRVQFFDFYGGHLKDIFENTKLAFYNFLEESSKNNFL